MDGWDTVDCTQRLTFSPCRPTQDPAIDTLRLEYLIAPCAVLALIFNYRLCVPSLPASTQQLTSPQLTHGAPLGVLHLPRGGRDPSSAVHAPADRRGGDDHDALLVCAGSVSRAVCAQLGVPVSWALSRTG